MREVMPDAIETRRLRLRSLRMADAPAIARFCGDPEVGRNLAMTPLPYLPIAAEGWIMTLAARAAAAQDFVFAVDSPGAGLIGVIGAHAGPQAVEIGYWYGRPFWGQGFASEALHSFVALARSLGPLQSGHFIDNPASGRVLEKNGFAYTGEVAAMFSMARGASVACRRMIFAASDDLARCARAVAA